MLSIQISLNEDSASPTLSSSPFSFTPVSLDEQGSSCIFSLAHLYLRTALMSMGLPISPIGTCLNYFSCSCKESKRAFSLVHSPAWWGNQDVRNLKQCSECLCSACFLCSGKSGIPAQGMVPSAVRSSTSFALIKIMPHGCTHVPADSRSHWADWWG